MSIRGTLGNVILTATVTVIGLAALEVYFLYAHHSPFEADAVAGYKFTHPADSTPPRNADGFFQEPVGPEAMEPETTRILFLGDSFTRGSGIRDGNDRFTERIAAQLNAEAPAGHRYHVYNAGIGGTWPEDWVGYLNKLLPKYRPDLIVTVFFLRDGTPMCTSLVCYKAQLDKLRAKHASGPLYRYSSVYRVIADRAMLDEFNSFYINKMLTSYLGSKEQRARWHQAQESLKKLAAIARENHIPFQLVVFPVLVQLARYPFDAVEAQIMRFASENGMPVFSLIDGFRGKRAADLWVAPGDQHPNELGHKIAADTMYPHLRRLLDGIETGQSSRAGD